MVVVAAMTAVSRVFTGAVSSTTENKLPSVERGSQGHRDGIDAGLVRNKHAADSSVWRFPLLTGHEGKTEKKSYSST